MHYLAFVITRTGTDKEVDKILAPYDENKSRRPDRGIWDWYQIGGRWTGFLDPSYDPEKDPRNQEVCGYCAGTGTRLDGLSGPGRCNACSQYSDRGVVPRGIRVKWPTEWAPNPGDTQPAEKVLALVEADPEKMVPYSLFTPTELHQKTVYHGELDYPACFVETPDYEAIVIDALHRAAAEGMIVVVVDYHS